MNNKSTKKGFNFNYLSVIFIYIWAGAFLIVSRQIQDPGSRLVPTFISIFAIVLATLLLLRTKRGKKEEALDFSGSKAALVMAVLLILYVILIEVLGFYIITPFYLYTAMWVLGQKNKKIMLAISLLMPLGVYLFFDLLLSMQIPEGLLLPWLLG